MRDSSYPSGLVYEDTPPIDLWLKLLLGGILVFTLVLGFVLLPIDPSGSWVMFGVSAFDAILFRLLSPAATRSSRIRSGSSWAGPLR